MTNHTHKIKQVSPSNLRRRKTLNTSTGYRGRKSNRIMNRHTSKDLLGFVFAAPKVAIVTSRGRLGITLEMKKFFYFPINNKKNKRKREDSG